MSNASAHISVSGCQKLRIQCNTNCTFNADICFWLLSLIGSHSLGGTISSSHRVWI
uniref:IMPL1 n=1 Tax=Arundo donax TaxID=35708 RepID=A0A0A9DI56_ARUDO